MHVRAYGGPWDGRLINAQNYCDFYAPTYDGTQFVRWKYEVHKFAIVKGAEAEPVFVLALVLSGGEMPSEHRLMADHGVLN